MLFKDVATTLERVESTTKRLEKSFIISQFLSQHQEHAYEFILLVQGKIFPEYDQTNIGMSVKLVTKAIAKASGKSIKDIEAQFNEIGDIGKVAQGVIAHKSQNTLFSQDLTLQDILADLRKFAKLSGNKSQDEKISSIAGMLGNATPVEARYICNVIIDQLRVGAAAGVLRDAIAWSKYTTLAQEVYPDLLFQETQKITVESYAEIRMQSDTQSVSTGNKEQSWEYLKKIIELIQRSADITSSLAETAKKLNEEGLEALEKVDVHVGRPFHVMLAQKAPSVSQAMESLGLPLFAEYKYDGFRMQMHKNNDVRLFTRRLEEVTHQFPDVVEKIKALPANNLVLDAEIVGVDKHTGKYLPFQSISQRIRRKYSIEEIADKFPVDIRVFDIIVHDGQTVIDVPFEKRRALVESVVQDTATIGPSKGLSASNAEDIEEFNAKALGEGNEGIMLKRMDSPYQPGSRVGFMLKYKPTMENLDVVITKATRGEGKRAQWFTSFTIAVADEAGDLQEIGKVSTGLKELDDEGTSFEAMTKLIEPLIEHDDGKQVSVKPQIVIEVAYEEIQQSPTYASGYALRFPRFVLLRDDRGLESISDLNYVHTLYEQQRGRNDTN